MLNAKNNAEDTMAENPSYPGIQRICFEKIRQ